MTKSVEDTARELADWHLSRGLKTLVLYKHGVDGYTKSVRNRARRAERAYLQRILDTEYKRRYGYLPQGRNGRRLDVYDVWLRRQVVSLGYRINEVDPRGTTIADWHEGVKHGGHEGPTGKPAKHG